MFSFSFLSNFNVKMSMNALNIGSATMARHVQTLLDPTTALATRVTMRLTQRKISAKVSVLIGRVLGFIHVDHTMVRAINSVLHFLWLSVSLNFQGSIVNPFLLPTLKTLAPSVIFSLRNMIRPRKGNANDLASPIITFYRFCSSFVKALEDLRAHVYHRFIDPSCYLFESELFVSLPYLALIKKAKICTKTNF